MKKRTTKILSALLALVLIFSVMPIATFAATSGDFEYEILDDGTVEITGYKGNAKTLNIPSEIQGRAVTWIGMDAFSGCNSITSVTIPDSVTFVGEYAFSDCKNLTSAVIGDGVESVNNSTFRNCEKLKSVVIGNGVTYLGSAFKGCYSLSDITILNSLTRIPTDSIFSDTAVYNDLKNWIDGVFFIDNCLIKADSREVHRGYTIPEGTRMIADEAFSGISLGSIVIPDSVKSIGHAAFASCYLDEVTIGSGVTYIGSAAFNNTHVTSTGSQYLKDGVIYIDGCLIGINGASGKCSVADGTRLIADSAFAGYSSIKSVTIPDSVTHMGIGAFDECDGLESVNIGKGVKAIGEYTFHNCTSLETLTLSEGLEYIGKSAFYNCTGLANVKIPDSVTHIGDFAFYNSLISASIPGSVTHIGYQAFGYISKSPTVVGVKSDNFIIYGEKNSAAEKYANENGFKFMNIDQYDPNAKPSESDTLVPKKGSNIEILTVNGTKVAKIPAERQVRDAIAAFDNKYIKVLYNDGERVPDLAVMSTGWKIQVLNSKGSVISEYTVMVHMDVNGDGKITAADARTALRASASLVNLSGVFFAAANTNDDNKITAADARKILRVSAHLEEA